MHLSQLNVAIPRGAAVIENIQNVSDFQHMNGFVHLRLIYKSTKRFEYKRSAVVDGETNNYPLMIFIHKFPFYDRK